MADEVNGEATTSTGQESANSTTADGSETVETVEEVKAKLAKAEELATNYKVRAEKAEREAKKPKTESEPKAQSSSNYQTDLYALVKANVPEEDVPDVEEYAKLKKISVAEALKSNVVKTILKDKAEQRASAEATHTGPAKRTTQRISDETLAEKAKKGEELSDEEMARYTKIRKGLK